MVNGNIVGFFPCKRGVLQGDPLSPLGFCLAEEVLSRAIELERVSSALQPMSYCRGISLPTHILYADDIFICCASTRKNIRCLLRMFNCYSEASGQLVNFDKSKLFRGAMMPARARSLARLSGFSLGVIPFQYLGFPIFQGKPKRIHFQAIVDRIKVKLASWKGSLLTIMGRDQLVKSIIHGMLVYSFHIYHWPQNILKLLDRWIKNFVWSGDIYTLKICTVKWNTVCLPLLQLSWNLHSKDSQCATLFRHRYFCNGTPRRGYIKSSVSLGIKSHMDMVIENSIWLIGNGEKINLWLDNWLGSSLVSVFNINPAARKSLCSTLSSVLDAGRWHLPPLLLSNSVVAASILNTTLPVTPLLDKLVWIHTTDGDLSAKKAFLFLRGKSNLIDWATLIWRPCIPPSHSFIFWRLVHKKLPTNEHLRSHGCTIVSICVLCFRAAETSEHLFFLVIMRFLSGVG